MARTAAEREEQQAAWDALRTGLRRDDYEIFELDDERVPVLLPLETRAALVQALGDEALRFRRSATWSKRMAGLYRTRRGTGLQVFGRGDRWGRWAYDDLILAFEERAALFAAMAKGYAALAKEPSSPVLEGALPHVTSPAGPEGDFSGNRAAVIATELRRALRDLLRLERKGLDRLRARTRGEEGAPTLSIVDRKAMRDLYPDAFSTAIVANLHDRSAKQVRGVSVLRSRLYEDAPLDGAFARARLIASALRRESNVVAPR